MEIFPSRYGGDNESVRDCRQQQSLGQTDHVSGTVGSPGGQQVWMLLFSEGILVVEGDGG